MDLPKGKVKTRTWSLNGFGLRARVTSINKIRSGSGGRTVGGSADGEVVRKDKARASVEVAGGQARGESRLIDRVVDHLDCKERST